MIVFLSVDLKIKWLPQKFSSSFTFVKTLNNYGKPGLSCLNGLMTNFNFQLESTGHLVFLYYLFYLITLCLLVGPLFGPLEPKQWPGRKPPKNRNRSGSKQRANHRKKKRREERKK